jgi:hypothetical protein
VGGVEEQDMWEIDEELGSDFDVLGARGFIDLTAKIVNNVNGEHIKLAEIVAAYHQDPRHNLRKNEWLASAHLVNAAREHYIRVYDKTGRLKPDVDQHLLGQIDEVGEVGESKRK